MTLKCPEHLVFAFGQFRCGLLDRDDIPGEVGEPYEVARDALRKDRDVLVRPLVERQVPRKVEEGRIHCGCGDVE